MIGAAAWRCVWLLIQNDLVHAWGVDLKWRDCVQDPSQGMAIVDREWVKHLGVPSLGEQGVASGGQPAWASVDQRRRQEWAIFDARYAGRGGAG